MQIKPIYALTPREIRELARHAADRGERIKDVNPYPRGSNPRLVFSRAYVHRAIELRPSGAR